MANIFDKLKKINLLRIFKLGNLDRQMIIIVSLAVFLISNFLISSLSFRYDSSFGQAYTLSGSTKKILHRLDDIVNIKYFVSSDLPAKLIPLKSDVSDILSEYKKESGSKIQLKILDPKKDEAAAKDAREAGIPELQFSQLESDKYAVTTSYFGITLNYGGKQEIIPQATNLENLEYDLTSAIYRLTNKELLKAGVIGKVEPAGQTQDPIGNFKKVLGQQFSVETIDLADTNLKAIDTGYKIIFIFDDNTSKYDDRQLGMIRNYLKKNGKAVIFADGVWVTPNLTTASAEHNLYPLLEDYGIKLNQDLLLSNSAALVNFGSGELSLPLIYPYWLTTNSFNNKVSYFSNIRQLTFPWSSSLTAEKKSAVEINELVKTMKSSWEQKGNYTLNPQQIVPPQRSDLKQFLLIAEADKKDGGQIVAVPSSRFVLDQFMGNNTGNLEFVLNISSSLASGGALSGIRSRTVSFYPLPDLNGSQKDLFKYINILLLPALFGIFGLIRLLKRR